MKLSNVAITVVCGVLLFAYPCRAQTFGTVSRGVHVRVTAPNLGVQEQEGQVAEVRGDTILVGLGVLQQIVEIPLESITVLEVRRRPGMGRRVAIGAVVGAGVGILSGLASGDDPPCSDIFVSDPIGQAICEIIPPQSAGFKAVVRAIILAPTGALVGLIAGALTMSEYWETVVPAPVRGVSVIPVHGGLAMQWSADF